MRDSTLWLMFRMLYLGILISLALASLSFA